MKKIFFVIAPNGPTSQPFYISHLISENLAKEIKKNLAINTEKQIAFKNAKKLSRSLIIFPMVHRDHRRSNTSEEIAAKYEAERLSCYLNIPAANIGLALSGKMIIDNKGTDFWDVLSSMNSRDLLENLIVVLPLSFLSVIIKSSHDIAESLRPKDAVWYIENKRFEGDLYGQMFVHNYWWHGKHGQQLQIREVSLQENDILLYEMPKYLRSGNISSLTAEKMQSLRRLYVKRKMNNLRTDDILKKVRKLEVSIQKEEEPVS